MKIAVVGIGVAGGYLLSRLKDRHEVTGFERMSDDKHDSICAWGSSKSKMIELCSKANIDFEKYVIHNGKKLHIDMNNTKFAITLKGLCTYDKIGIIKDMIKGCEVNYNSVPKLHELEKNYDLILDTTGFHRMYLPKINNDFYLPTFQYKIKYKKLPLDDFYVKPFTNMTGYLWYFPLNEHFAHVGAGDYMRAHVSETEMFFKKYGGKIIKKVGRPIRLAVPNMCEPFFSGKVIGVGESIGSIYPLLGEGIIPSMICADIFIKNIYDHQKYRKEVLRYFNIYNKVFKFVRNKMKNEFNIVKQLPDLISIFKYMKTNEDRFGMKINMRDLLKVARA